ncbi:hypothetical protein MM326_03510 [Alkalihalobacillus sp. LMS6]|uniref:alpha/beta fold hydrolase n=1 Tax=Bacillaceae TaxID=186817 RepID=UPI000C08A4CD|nr:MULTISPECIES: hypothetical protein [Bacillaceae]UTR07114.1 hypothetical protein MM326_03510 [Alkalihalobacillus sp. LMS6]
MKTTNLKINESHVHYYEWGTNKKASMVCLHGLANTGAVFSELADFLKDEYHLISFDSAGHGKTSSFKKEQIIFSQILPTGMTTFFNKFYKSLFIF